MMKAKKTRAISNKEQGIIKLTNMFARLAGEHGVAVASNRSGK